MCYVLCSQMTGAQISLGLSNQLSARVSQYDFEQLTVPFLYAFVVHQLSCVARQLSLVAHQVSLVFP